MSASPNRLRMFATPIRTSLVKPSRSKINPMTMLNRVSASLLEYKNAEKKYNQASKNLHQAHKESRNS